MHDFRRLHVWRLAWEFGTDVYRDAAKVGRPESIRRVLYSRSKRLPA